MFKFLFIFIVLLSGCAPKEKTYIDRPLYDLYSEAKNHINKKQYSKGAFLFKQVQAAYPYSEWSISAQIMEGFCYFLMHDFETCEATFRSFCKMYPNSIHKSYALYMIALSLHERLSLSTRDCAFASLAITAIEELVQLYPRSKYAKSVMPLKSRISSFVSSHSLEIGKLYQKLGIFTAAMNRYKDAIQYKNPVIAEAYYRMIECCLSLNLNNYAVYYNQKLYNDFPKSDWSRIARTLLLRRNLI